MDKVIEGKFRVLRADDEDIQLQDVSAPSGVFVETKSDDYTSKQEELIQSLRPGYLIVANIASETVADGSITIDGITRADNLWYFITIDIVEETEFHFVDSVSQVPAIAESLSELLDHSTAAGPHAAIRNGEEILGYISVSSAIASSNMWNGLRAGTNSHEIAIDHLLRDLSEPPYEVIYTRTQDREWLVFYHLCKKDTPLANSIIESGTNLSTSTTIR